MKKAYLSITVVAALAALAVAGCGGGGSSTSAGSYGGGSEESAGGNPESASSTAGAAGGAASPYGNSASSGTSAVAGGGEAVTVSVGSASGVGQVLVDSNGMTLYYFEKDQKGSGKSNCEGACASAWPPLTASGEAKAMSGVNASMLGTIERPDGTNQVTYAGWPLYTFVEDKKPGEDNGTDIKAFGGSWYPLHSNGQKAGH